MSEISLQEANRIRKQKGRHILTKAQYSYVVSRGLGVTLWTSAKRKSKKRRARHRRRRHRY